MRDHVRLPFLAVPNQPLQATLSAADPEQHVTGSWSSLPVLPGAGAYSCTGDACGCCLLTAADPQADCRGLAGITSPDFPGGLCRAF